jgi:hypothetical protein
VILLFVLVCAGGVAEGADRSGFMIGVSIGVGMAGGSDTLGLSGGQLDVQAGAALGRRWVAFVSVGGVSDALGYGAAVHLGVAARRWLTGRWWTEAGVGFGSAGAQTLAPEREGLATWLATGLEIRQRRNFALDLQARYGRLGAPRYEIVSAGLGFTWY